MGLTYANVPLPVPTRETRAWVEANLSTADLREWCRRYWPHKNLTGMTFYDPPSPDRSHPVKLMTLQWPAGANRFAVGHFLATDDELPAIRNAVQNSAGSAKYSVPVGFKMGAPATLALSDGTGRRIQTDLFMMPPQLLGQRRVAGGDTPRGFYLLTLVDVRFYWQMQAGVISVAEGITTWQDLYAQISSNLGFTGSYDAISPNYFMPCAGMGQRYENLALLFDAIAYNVGQRVSRLLDGTVSVDNVDSSKGDMRQDLGGGWPIQAGGQYTLEG